MQLFDDGVRSDGSPKKASEDSFSFLNRAAGPFWATIRDELERWFAEYPASEAPDLRSRFRNRRPDQHWAAWWELYLFRLFSCLGFGVDVHPEMPATTTRPDFRLRRERTVYVEAATVFSGIVDEGRSAEREAWMVDALNEVRSTDFVVWLHFDQIGMERPGVREVTTPVEKWLTTLDADEADQVRAPRGHRAAARPQALSRSRTTLCGRAADMSLLIQPDRRSPHVGRACDRPAGSVASQPEKPNSGGDMGTLQAVVGHADEKSLDHFNEEIVSTVELVEPGSWVLIGRVTVMNHDDDAQKASAAIVHDNTHRVVAQDDPGTDAWWEGIAGRYLLGFYLQAAVRTESERETFTLQCRTYKGWAKSPSLIALMVDTIKFQ